MSVTSSLSIILFACVPSLLLAPHTEAQAGESKPTRCSPSKYVPDELQPPIEPAASPERTIDSMEFDGANYLSGAEREELIASIKGLDFDDDVSWREDAVHFLSDFWRDHGFFKVNVRVEERILNPGSAPQYMGLTIHVEEGPQYRLKDIHFRSSDHEVPLVFPPEQLRKMVPMQDGDLFSVSDLRDCLDSLKELYDSRGYMDFTSTPVTDIDDASSQISLTFELDQELLFHIARIDFLGDRPQAEKIVRSRIKVGDIFSDRDIEDFYERNKSLLPRGASPTDLIATRNKKSGTVDLTFDFRDCTN